MTEKEFVKIVARMKIHDVWGIDDGTTMMRVTGGVIYQFYTTDTVAHIPGAKRISCSTFVAVPDADKQKPEKPKK